jgi:hypothetical protein
MQRLDPDWRADARLQLQAKDRLCNAHMIEPRLAITQGAAAPRLESASLTIKEVADSLRAEFRGRADDGALLRAGRTAAQMHAQRHGRPPGKHDEMHNGRVLQVNSYTEGDRALLEEAVRRTMQSGSRPVTEFFAPVVLRYTSRPIQVQEREKNKMPDAPRAPPRACSPSTSRRRGWTPRTAS